MAYNTTRELFDAVLSVPAQPEYPLCSNEREFENEIWTRLWRLVTDGGLQPERHCLTSHTWAARRSAAEWRAFCAEEFGADVNVLGSNNRLDIVLRHPDGGTIGIEVKCLGAKNNAGKLTQGIGQAMLALANRSYTILAIHCGTVDVVAQRRLQSVADKVCASSKMSIVVVA